MKKVKSKTIMWLGICLVLVIAIAVIVVLVCKEKNCDDKKVDIVSTEYKGWVVVPTNPLIITNLTTEEFNEQIEFINEDKTINYRVITLYDHKIYDSAIPKWDSVFQEPIQATKDEKGFIFNSGDKIYWKLNPKYMYDGLIIMAYQEEHIVGAAFVHIYESLETQNFCALLKKSIKFDKIDGEYQDVTEQYVKDMAKEIFADVDIYEKTAQDKMDRIQNESNKSSEE